MEIKLRPIGVVRTKGTDAEVKEKGDLEGELVIYPDFQEALEGIDGYSHLFVIVYFNRLRAEQIGPLTGEASGPHEKRIHARRASFTGSFRAGFTDAAESDRAHAGALSRARGKSAFRSGARFF